MTKKTNALILRYNVSTFWKNKCPNNKKGLKILRLENIIYKEVNKKKLEVFKINYKNKKYIQILVYNIGWFKKNIIKHVIKYYEKVLNLKAVISKFGLCDRYILYLLRGIGVRSIKLGSLSNILNSYRIVQQCIKKNRIKNIKKNLNFWFGYSEKLKLFKLIEIVNLSFKVYNNQILRNKHKKLKKNIKLKKVNSIVKFKLFTTNIENLFFWLFKDIYMLDIQNILCKGGLSINISLNDKFKKKQNFREIFYIMFLSSNFRSSSILSKYIAIALKKNKNHFKIIKEITNIVSYYFLRKIYTIKGMQIRVAGKLGGKMRRSKYHYKIGQVQLQTIQMSLSYSMAVSYTKYGILSVKVWLIYAKY